MGVWIGTLFSLSVLVFRHINPCLVLVLRGERIAGAGVVLARGSQGRVSYWREDSRDGCRIGKRIAGAGVVLARERIAGAGVVLARGYWRERG
jgi:hypothetical protein